jgi:hypothetical protein
MSIKLLINYIKIQILFIFLYIKLIIIKLIIIKSTVFKHTVKYVVESLSFRWIVQFYKVVHHYLSISLWDKNK